MFYDYTLDMRRWDFTVTIMTNLFTPLLLTMHLDINISYLVLPCRFGFGVCKGCNMFYDYSLDLRRWDFTVMLRKVLSIMTNLFTLLLPTMHLDDVYFISCLFTVVWSVQDKEESQWCDSNWSNISGTGKEEKNINQICCHISSNIKVQIPCIVKFNFRLNLLFPIS